MVTLPNLKTPGVGGEDHILNRGDDTGLTDVKSAMMTPTGGTVVPGRAAATAEVTGEDCKPDPETEAGVRFPSSS